MAFVVGGHPNGTSHHQFLGNKALNLWESCLDMVDKGTITEAKVDEFNIPLFSGTPEEIEAIVKRHGCFDIEKIDTVIPPVRRMADPRELNMLIVVGLLTDQFRQVTTKEIFGCWRKKLEDPSHLDAEIGFSELNIGPIYYRLLPIAH